MTTVADLEAADMVVTVDDRSCIITLPDDGSGQMEVRVAMVDGELQFQPTRSALQRRALALANGR